MIQVSLSTSYVDYDKADECDSHQSKRSNVVTRPVILGEEEKGGQLPLRMRRVRKQ